MLEFIARISLVCFAASYGVALALEISRVYFRAPVRIAVLIVFVAAGLLAHTLYLWHRLVEELPAGTPLSGWHDWCLLSAWIVVSVYLILAIRKPETLIGLFLLPLVLVLIGAAYLAGTSAQFPRDQALLGWRVVHGLALLSGTAVVTLGCAAGVMFLVQSYRLKHHASFNSRFKLPSLEQLQWASERSLVLSSGLLLLGLGSGIVMNMIEHAERRTIVPWTEPVVWTSALLLAWLVAASVFNYFYKPARRGQKVAYLVVASFVFLGLELGVVLWTQHATERHSGGIYQIPQVQLVQSLCERPQGGCV